MVPRMIVPLPPPPPPPQPLSARSSAAAAVIRAPIPRPRVIQLLSPSRELPRAGRTQSHERKKSRMRRPCLSTTALRLPSRGAGNRPRQLLGRRERDRRGPRRAAQAGEAVGELPASGTVALAESPGHHVGEEGPPELPGIEAVPPAEGDRPNLAFRAILATRWIATPAPKLEPAPGPASACIVDFHPERALPEDRQHVLFSRRAATYEMPSAAQTATQVEVNRWRRPAAAPGPGVEDLLGAGGRVPERAIHRHPAVAVQTLHQQGTVDVIGDVCGLDRVGRGATGGEDAALSGEAL